MADGSAGPGVLAPRRLTGEPCRPATTFAPEYSAQTGVIARCRMLHGRCSRQAEGTVDNHAVQRASMKVTAVDRPVSART